MTLDRQSWNVVLNVFNVNSQITLFEKLIRFTTLRIFYAFLIALEFPAESFG